MSMPWIPTGRKSSKERYSDGMAALLK